MIQNPNLTGPQHGLERDSEGVDDAAGLPQTPPGSRRYASDLRIFGIPAVVVALGPCPERGESKGVAKGWIAVGDIAMGGIAIGGVSIGAIGIGGVGLGLAGVGGVGVGLLAGIGGTGAGALAFGGAAVGGFTTGGAAFGYAALGGGAFGQYAAGGGAKGAHTINNAGADPAAVQFFQDQSWFFGTTAHTPDFVAPILATGGAAMGVALVVLGIVGLGFISRKALGGGRTA